MTTFESDVKVISYSKERVYNKLSDLNNLEALKDRLPEDKVNNVNFDTDTLSFSAPAIGQLTLKVVEREPFNCIKFETTNSPIPFNLWVQLVAVSEEECQLMVLVSIELNPFMKAMIQKPLEEGLAKMLDILAMIRY